MIASPLTRFSCKAMPVHSKPMERGSVRAAASSIVFSASPELTPAAAPPLIDAVR